MKAITEAQLAAALVPVLHGLPMPVEDKNYIHAIRDCEAESPGLAAAIFAALPGSDLPSDWADDMHAEEADETAALPDTGLDAEDAAVGRNLRRLADALPVGWRIGLVRSDTGWRLVLLNPEDGQPISFLDGPTLNAIFSDEASLTEEEGS